MLGILFANYLRSNALSPVPARGLEPLTFGSVDRCSIQLSYAGVNFKHNRIATADKCRPRPRPATMPLNLGPCVTQLAYASESKRKNRKIRKS
jgi:hypothetical protein